MQKRASTLLLGFIAVTACSVDHLLVAALDDMSAAGSSEGGADGSLTAVGNEGGGGALVGSGGTAAFGGARSAAEGGGDSFILGGGSSVLLGSAGAAGDGTEFRCSCLGQQPAQVCGTDGLTYPIECSDAGPCFPPAIDCWHACPCLDAGLDGMGEATWFPFECAATAHCSGNIVCMKFSNVVSDPEPLCGTAN
jgi:hypothetical protein